MKDKLKNTLTHDVELLGRSVSVLAIVGLLVVGGASAALLTSFGTVSGEADVDQAIVFGENGAEEGETTLSDFDSAEVTAGAELVDSATLTNNADGYLTASFQSYQKFTEESTGDGEGPDEEGNVEGMDTGFLAAYEPTVKSETANWDGSGYDFDADTDNEASAEVVYDEEEDSAAVHVETSFEETGVVSGGIEFNVSEFTFDSDSTLEVSYRTTENHRDGDEEKAPDWVVVETEDGITYGDYNVYTSTDNGEFSTTLGDLTLDPYGQEGELTDYSEIETVFIGSGTSDSENDPSGSGQDSDIYYYDVSLGDHHLMKSIPHSVTGSGDREPKEYDVPPGETEVFAANELQINAWPGDYTVSAEAVPQSEVE